MSAEKHDVIQLDPEHGTWGPMLCIVSDVHSWGVTAYWLVATERGKAPDRAYVRANHGTYIVVGKAEWVVQ